MSRLRSLLLASVVAAVLLPAVPSRATIAAPSAAAATEPHLHTHADGPELDPTAVGDVLKQWEVDALAPWSPAQYDGVELGADAADTTQHPTVHAVYLYPSDGENRFQQYAAMFQADARQASELLRTRYGRGVRFDERVGADSNTYLDITVVRSIYTTAQLAVPQTQFFLVSDELRWRLPHPGKKYAVWLDAPSSFCGQASLADDDRRTASNWNEGRSTAIVYRSVRKAVTDAASGGFCRGRTLLHELGHAFGALQSVAPNAFDGAHCADSAEDVMCYAPPAVIDTGGPEFDYGNDDYWDPRANPASGRDDKLPWWTVNLSRFVCPTNGCSHANVNPGY